MRIARALTATLLLALLLATPVVAQEDADLRAAIDRLMDLTGAMAIGEQFGQVLADQFIDGGGAPGLTPESAEAARMIVREILSRAFADGSLQDELAGIYARHFSQDEVEAMIEFYETPVGRKTIELLPVIMNESVTVAQGWAARVIPTLEGDLLQRLRDEDLIEH